jgi:archaellum component FlaC
MYGRLGTLETSLATSDQQQAKLAERLDAAESSMQTTVAGVNQKLDTAQQQLETRSTQIQRQQRASLNRLVKEQKQQIAAVTGEVEGVKSEVGTVKSDVETTKSDLAATKDKLEHTIGDLGVQSGLIAHTREDLEALRRRGERNYYEFTLLKGKRPVPVSTVSLQLKKVDPKKSKFTLNVIADDRTIEKKDRTMYEPLQFYTAKDRHLYEVVVFTAEKNKVTGYLSTPKGPIVARMSSETK